MMLFVALGFTSCRNDDGSSNRPTVRLVYIVPQDRSINQSYNEVIASGAKSIQKWYGDQLANGKNFHYTTGNVEVLKSSHPAAWFNAANNTTSGSDNNFYFFNNSKSDLKSLLGQTYDTSKYAYIVYVDAPGKWGFKEKNIAIMPEEDLLGLTGKMASQPNPNRWIGGMAHMFGFTMGLPGGTQADGNTLMKPFGFNNFPNVILTQSEKEILNKNPFFY